jgi:YteA family regulatory protein
MDKLLLQYFENRLMHEKRCLEESVELAEQNNYKDSLWDSTSELSSYDNHPADLGSETYEMEKRFALMSHQEHRIREVDHALEKIKAGSYGTCDLCEKEIPYERLEAYPQANLCIECEEESRINVQYLDNDRPIEEGVLQPPFGRTSKLEKETNMYDGEDAWQDVAVYNKTDHVNIDWYDHYFDTENDEETGVVEEVEKISNQEYIEQIPDSYVETVDEGRLPKIDYFGDGHADDN